MQWAEGDTRPHLRVLVLEVRFIGMLSFVAEAGERSLASPVYYAFERREGRGGVANKNRRNLIFACLSILLV